MIRYVFITMLLLAAAPSVAAEDQGQDPVTKTLVWPDGTRYVGGVLDGKRSGKGTIFWQDGTRFVGHFQNDKRNGPGTMILPDGTVYTGFFKDDELVDTESTIAASQQMSDADTDELGDTEMPMEADSLITTVKDVPPVDEHDLLEPTEEPSESIEEDAEEPVEDVVAAEPPVEPQPEATEETQLASAQETTSSETPVEEPIEAAETIDESDPTEPDFFESEDVTAVTDNVKESLISTIDLWAAAWSDQNVVQYLTNYSDDFSVPGKQSRRNWEALRRTRLTRPRFIEIEIDYQRFELVETNVVDAFFRQSYRSNTYSDLTDKVLRMRKEGTDWKILIERSR